MTALSDKGILMVNTDSTRKGSAQQMHQHALPNQSQPSAPSKKQVPSGLPALVLPRITSCSARPPARGCTCAACATR